MRVYRPLTGIAVFEVLKDRRVLLLDLQLIGLRFSRRLDAGYARHFEVMDEALRSFNLNMGDFKRVESLVLKYRGRPVFCQLYYVDDDLIRYVALASPQPGVMARLTPPLTSTAGWKRLMLLELRPRRPMQRRL